MDLNFAFKILPRGSPSTPPIVTIEMTEVLRTNIIKFESFWDGMQKALQLRDEDQQVDALYFKASQVMIGCAFMFSDLKTHLKEQAIRIQSRRLVAILKNAQKTLIYIQQLYEHKEAAELELPTRGCMAVVLLLSQLFIKQEYHEYINEYADEIISNNQAKIVFGPKTLRPDIIQDLPDAHELEFGEQEHNITALYPDYNVRVSKYFLNQILLYSPRDMLNESSAIPFRQVNEITENKVWVQDGAAKYIGMSFRGEAVDNAHGVVVTNGEGNAFSQRDAKYNSPYRYYRGQRIWVQWTSQTSKHIDKLPVVDLESGERFEISCEHICFVPRLKHRGESEYYAAIGPRTDVFVNRKKSWYQLYVHWAEGVPGLLTTQWLDLRDKNTKKKVQGLAQLKPSECNQAFRAQWEYQTAQFMKTAALVNESMVPDLECTIASYVNVVQVSADELQQNFAEEPLNNDALEQEFYPMDEFDAWWSLGSELV